MLLTSSSSSPSSSDGELDLCLLHWAGRPTSRSAGGYDRGGRNEGGRGGDHGRRSNRDKGRSDRGSGQGKGRSGRGRHLSLHQARSEYTWRDTQMRRMRICRSFPGYLVLKNPSGNDFGFRKTFLERGNPEALRLENEVTRTSFSRQARFPEAYPGPVWNASHHRRRQDNVIWLSHYVLSSRICMSNASASNGGWLVSNAAQATQ